MTIDRDQLVEKTARALVEAERGRMADAEWKIVWSGMSPSNRNIARATAVLDAILPTVQAQTMTEAIALLEKDGYFCPALEQREAEYRKGATE